MWLQFSPSVHLCVSLGRAQSSKPCLEKSISNTFELDGVVHTETKAAETSGLENLTNELLYGSDVRSTYIYKSRNASAEHVHLGKYTCN